MKIPIRNRSKQVNRPSDSNISIKNNYDIETKLNNGLDMIRSRIIYTMSDVTKHDVRNNKRYFRKCCCFSFQATPTTSSKMYDNILFSIFAQSYCQLLNLEINEDSNSLMENLVYASYFTAKYTRAGNCCQQSVMFALYLLENNVKPEEIQIISMQNINLHQENHTILKVNSYYVDALTANIYNKNHHIYKSLESGKFHTELIGIKGSYKTNSKIKLSSIDEFIKYSKDYSKYYAIKGINLSEALSQTGDFNMPQEDMEILQLIGLRLERAGCLLS